MKLYVVTANVHIKDKDGWIKTLDIPTFFLSKDIQGIVSEEHAKKIVGDMLNPTADSNIRVSSSIVEIDSEEQEFVCDECGESLPIRDANVYHHECVDKIAERLEEIANNFQIDPRQPLRELAAALQG